VDDHGPILGDEGTNTLFTEHAPQGRILTAGRRNHHNSPILHHCEQVPERIGNGVLPVEQCAVHVEDHQP